jgi:hypothetical protein
MITEVDLDGKTIEDVVDDWMDRQRGALEGLDRPVTRRNRGVAFRLDRPDVTARALEIPDRF